MDNSIAQISKSRNISPGQIRKEIENIIIDMWKKGILKSMYAKIPSAEEFIEKFSFIIPDLFK